MRLPSEIHGTREERVAQFKNDAELMGVATKLVSEVIEKAKVEAMRRRKPGVVPQQVSVEGRGLPGDDDDASKRVRWHRRARGFFVRALAILCFRPRRSTGSFVLAATGTAAGRPQTA